MNISAKSNARMKQNNGAAIFVLAAGTGSRLFPFSMFIPKPLFPISRRKYLISFVLDICRKSCLDTYVMVRKGQESLFDKINKDNNKEPFSIISSPYNRETGGEILNHFELISTLSHEYIIVVPADYYINNFDPVELIKYMSEEKLDMCILGCLIQKDGEYIQSDENGYIAGITKNVTEFSGVGIYSIKTSVLRSSYDLCGKSITSTEFLNILISRGYRSKIFNFLGQWKDLGTWTRYLAFLFSLYFNPNNLFKSRL